MKIAFGVALLALFAAAQKPADPDPMTSNAKFRLLATNSVVLPIDRRTMQQFADFEPQDISSGDYPLVESILMERVAAYNAVQMRDYLKDKKADPRVDSLSYFIQLPRYKIQLVGLKAKDGTALVYVNCVGRHYEGMWQTRFMDVLDGGNNYFHLILDLKKKSCINFRVNGQA